MDTHSTTGKAPFLGFITVSRIGLLFACPPGACRRLPSAKLEPWLTSENVISRQSSNLPEPVSRENDRMMVKSPGLFSATSLSILDIGRTVGVTIRTLPTCEVAQRQDWEKPARRRSCILSKNILLLLYQCARLETLDCFVTGT